MDWFDTIVVEDEAKSALRAQQHGVHAAKPRSDGLRIQLASFGLCASQALSVVDTDPTQDTYVRGIHKYVRIFT